ncbi:glycosyltransferase family 2 protein [Dermatophilus congolensis]|uniref:N-glycosyltransferase n=1 Tax=Dermatophilus congolensis TaxID=1863 RepID=A0AA46BP29_9MICO|nr:glycosyltransferase family A protein [Dermatophilus congolensis]MBO3143278.1 glycosyltransferase family 2 protein [Dermatophilus congolensis]MBO3152265.1 glycosyltransferase family 2 protein [Dermatophilus congolensis]MBO3160723.1 glycosyltransferase family 2 protein [Dermatophilus congolensis]MBO3163553.1 glycosyltransferase family 2 protein [Dermatophilus congolensis]MBO3177099.1 glycosyltransferase family 2 protein [Dermatophilus congolensis]
MPRLTVLMPVRNGQRYLPTALSSLAATLPRDAHVRIMDDGSSDSTPALLAAAAERDSRFIIHRHDHGHGVANSLNELARASDSEYIARMDADDIVMVGRWSLSRLALRNADFVFTTSLHINATGNITGVDQPGRFSAAATPFHLLLGSMLVHPSVTMRRSAFDALGGYTDVPAEDYELWLRAAANGYRLVRTAVPGLKYRRHDEQVTATSPWSNPDPDSPMFTAYGSLLDYTLGHRQEGWRAVFASALGRTPLTPEETAWTHAMQQDIIDTVQRQLNPHDAALVMWRARREWRRADQRSTQNHNA